MNTTTIPAHELRVGDIVVRRVPCVDGGTLDNPKVGRSSMLVTCHDVKIITPMSSRRDRRGLPSSWKGSGPAPCFAVYMTGTAQATYPRDFEFEVVR